MTYTWPKQADCDKFYGNPRGADPSGPSAAWELENLTYIVPPYKMFYDKRPVSRLRVHKKCGAALSEALNNILKAANGDQKLIDHWGASVYGGGYLYRLKRSGTTLSMHSYGCAIDLDPANNGFRDPTPRLAQFPQVVKAFKDVGAVWGGDWKNNTDGMHFQFAIV